MTSKVQYLSHYGKICPACNRVDSVKIGAFKVKKKVAYRKCKCLHCKATWLERWSLSGYERLKPPGLGSDVSEIEKRGIPVDGPLATGTQVVCIPSDRSRQAIEREMDYGFVIEPKGEYFHYCRFWSKKNPSRLNNKTGILVPNSSLIQLDSVTQDQVEEVLKSVRIK